MKNYKIEKLTYYYPRSEKPALNNISLDVKKGETILLVGESGCGKSTLLRLMAGLIPCFYGGIIGGTAVFEETEITELKKPLSPRVGILFQDPENQLFMSDIESEIAFPLENLGIKRNEIGRRIDETIISCGLQEIRKKKINTLSSGQKQRAALASILAMNPEVLLLDEPTSQLDPDSAEELMDEIGRFSQDCERTLIISEHRLERCIHMVSRVIAMDNGSIIFDGDVQEYCKWAYINKFEHISAIPKLFNGLGLGKLPVTFNEGRRLIVGIAENCRKEYSFPLELPDTRREENKHEPEIKMNDIYFSYDGNNHVLKGINLEVRKGEFIGIFGQNGAGKTTLAQNICGLLKPSKGLISINEIPASQLKSSKIAYIGQNPDNYLFNDTIADEINFTLGNLKMKRDPKTQRLLEQLGLTKIENQNPRDVSVGQKQRAALASIMCIFPDILILDEPTRGMDYNDKKTLGQILKSLNNQKTTIILITHDIDFAGEICDRLIIMRDGEITADGKTRDIMKSSSCYKTQTAKLFEGINDFISFEEAREWIVKQLTVDS